MENITFLEFLTQYWLTFLSLQIVICAVVLKLYIKHQERKEVQNTLVRCDVLLTNSSKNSWIDRVRYELGLSGSIMKAIDCSIGWRPDLEQIQARILLIMILLKQLKLEIPYLDTKNWIELAQELEEQMTQDSAKALEALKEPNSKVLNIFANSNDEVKKAIQNLHNVVKSHIEKNYINNEKDFEEQLKEYIQKNNEEKSKKSVDNDKKL